MYEDIKTYNTFNTSCIVWLNTTRWCTIYTCFVRNSSILRYRFTIELNFDIDKVIVFDKALLILPLNSVL